MATTVKTCDLSGEIAAHLFEMLNRDLVKVERPYGVYGGLYIITDTEPMELCYPEGWYYAKGALRNKHQSTTGAYSEVMMIDSDGEYWNERAKYCTLDN